MKTEIQTKRFTVILESESNVGTFERDADGSGGNLYIDYCYDGAVKVNPMLVDYDGFAVLPKEVIQALRDNGVEVDVDFE